MSQQKTENKRDHRYNNINLTCKKWTERTTLYTACPNIGHLKKANPSDFHSRQILQKATATTIMQKGLPLLCKSRKAF